MLDRGYDDMGRWGRKGALSLDCDPSGERSESKASVERVCMMSAGGTRAPRNDGGLAGSI